MVQDFPCWRCCMNTWQEDNPCPPCLYLLAISTWPGCPHAQVTGKSAVMWKGCTGSHGPAWWLPSPDRGPSTLDKRIMTNAGNHPSSQNIQLTACHSASNCWCFPLSTFPWIFSIGHGNLSCNDSSPITVAILLLHQCWENGSVAPLPFLNSS